MGASQIGSTMNQGSVEEREVCVMLPAVPACGQPLPLSPESMAAGFQALQK